MGCLLGESIVSLEFATRGKVFSWYPSVGDKRQECIEDVSFNCNVSTDDIMISGSCEPSLSGENPTFVTPFVGRDDDFEVRVKR